MKTTEIIARVIAYMVLLFWVVGYTSFCYFLSWVAWPIHSLKLEVGKNAMVKTDQAS